MDRESLSLLIKNIRLIDPARDVDNPKADLIIVNGILQAIGRDYDQTDIPILDCSGRTVVAMPPAIDLHVHFRSPGNPDAEDITSGAAAAIAGGFGRVVMMANTMPVIDNETLVARQLELGKNAVIGIDTVCALTKGLDGQELVDVHECSAAGAVAFTDDGRNLATPEIAWAGLQKTAEERKPILVHAEDEAMITPESRPSEAERSAIAKWIACLEKVPGARLHIQHISTAAGLRLVEDAIERDLAITCEVTPHHLALVEPAALDTLHKVNPPLRTEADVEALRRGLRDGLIDAIATDHAPHTREAKSRPYAQAPSGMIGLELAWPLLLQAGLTGPSMAAAVHALTVGPANFLGIEVPTLTVGQPASFVLLDTESRWTVDGTTLSSRSQNTPLFGQEVNGRVLLHVAGGQIVHSTMKPELARV